MELNNRPSDSVIFFINELSSRVVAKTGIPSDRHHLGKLILQSLKDAPDFVLQIDGATNQSETNRSVLERSVRCATAFKKYGLKVGDVITLMAPNHLDVTIPFYAALYLGIAISSIDRNLKVQELQHFYNITKPKIIFCQSEKAPDAQVVLSNLGLDTQIVTFDEANYLSFSEFLEKYSDNTSIENFTATDFDPNETISLLAVTSGSTGLPKAAAITHSNYAYSIPNVWSNSKKIPTPTKLAMIISPLQWITAQFTFILSAVLRYTRLQTSENTTKEHIIYLINTYRPTYAIFSPTIMTVLIRDTTCDFSCLEIITVGGSFVSNELIDKMKEISPNTDVCNVFGMTELSGPGLHIVSARGGSSGPPLGCLQYRLIDVESQKDINEPNVTGELWVKGPVIFKEYYNNPKATEEVFAEGRWFKTGDLFYRDENLNFYFVDRLKFVLRINGYGKISPMEIENVIRRHPEVSDVAIAGIPDAESGSLLVAVVVRAPGSSVSAQQIKDVVKETLSDAKQLRGGVIFTDALPLTATSKINRKRIMELVMNMKRE